MPSHLPVAGFRKPLRSGAGSRATSAWPRIAALPRAREPLLLLDGLPLSPSAWRPENPEGTAFHRSKASQAAPTALGQAYFSQLSLTCCQQYWCFHGPALGRQRSPPPGLALNYHVRMPNRHLSLHCVFYKAPAHAFTGPSQLPCEARGRAPSRAHAGS